MANGNVNRAVTVAMGALGLIGVSWGVQSLIGPAQRMNEHERRIAKVEDIAEQFIKHDAAQLEANKAIIEKLDRLMIRVKP